MSRPRVLVLERDEGVRAELGRLFDDDYDVVLFACTDAAVAAMRRDDEYALAVCEFNPRAPAARALVGLVGGRERDGRLRCAVTLTEALREDLGPCACAVLVKPFTRRALLAALRL